MGRAFFVDDNYQMLMARGAVKHPLRPYDFKADDNGLDNSGWDRGQPPRMVNPPLHHYILGLFSKCVGHRLAGVRSLSLLLAGGSAVFIYLLAARLAVPPWGATVMSVLTPAFWLSSYSLLIDSTLLFFFLGALWTWIEGLRRRSSGWLGVSGTLMGLALLTKYTGVLLFPVAALYAWTDREHGRRWKPWLTFLIPLAFFAAWSVWNMATYGAVHFTESAKRVVQTFTLGHVLIFLIFLGGVFLIPLATWGGLGGNRRTVTLGFVVALGLMVLLMSPWGGFGVGTSLLMAVLAVGGLMFLWETVVLLKDPNYFSDPFLVGWLWLGSMQMIFVMPWVAARYYLTLVVPVVFLLVRMGQRRWALAPSKWARAQGGAVAVLFLFSAGLAVGDYLQADAQRAVSRDVLRDNLLEGGRRGVFLGDSFTSSYLKTVGWEPGFPNTDFSPGTLVLKQEVVMPPWWFRPKSLPLRPLKRYVYPSRWPWRVMDNNASAGFYASCWGGLPFAFSQGPLERYALYEVGGPH
ncbi:MAG: glycosyltransferase family 39 protein [Elusimicrobia bacterium]|nr:glycosyltransferase family 39 protein [Elusimicrobiota bacterium]